MYDQSLFNCLFSLFFLAVSDSNDTTEETSCNDAMRLRINVHPRRHHQHAKAKATTTTTKIAISTTTEARKTESSTVGSTTVYSVLTKMVTKETPPVSLKPVATKSKMN